MQFSTIAAVSSLLASAAALPTVSNIVNGTALPADAKFQLAAIRSGSDVQFAPFQAAQSSISLRMASQGATCDRPEIPGEGATFFLKDGGLFLYAASATPQQLYVDRSGMGQGRFGYTTGAEPAPANAERTGFAVDAAGYFTFDGASFVACPAAAGAWSVWVSAGVDQPAGNSGCLPIAARPVEVAAPNSCSYTS